MPAKSKGCSIAEGACHLGVALALQLLTLSPTAAAAGHSTSPRAAPLPLPAPVQVEAIANEDKVPALAGENRSYLRFRSLLAEVRVASGGSSALTRPFRRTREIPPTDTPTPWPMSANAEDSLESSFAPTSNDTSASQSPGPTCLLSTDASAKSRGALNTGARVGIAMAALFVLLTVFTVLGIMTWSKRQLLDKAAADSSKSTSEETTASPTTWQSCLHHPYGVFLIHTGAQRGLAVSTLARSFSDQGFCCFGDWKMELGSHPREQMETALETCRHAIVVLSKEFLKRPHPLAELSYSYRRMKWIHQQYGREWCSLWVILFDLSVDDYCALQKARTGELPPLNKDIVLMQYASGKGKYETWPQLCDELISRIAVHDQESASEKWNSFLSDWLDHCNAGFPRAGKLYEETKVDSGPSHCSIQ